MMNTLPSTQEVQSAIHRVRGTRLVLAEGLAQFYGKSVSAFNQAAGYSPAPIFDADQHPCPRPIVS